MSKLNLLIIHGGGPTTVINASLYGAVTEAKKHSEIGNIYGANGGSLAASRGDFINLREIPDNKLEQLLYTPSSAIGTSRDCLEEKDYDAIAQSVLKNNINIVCYNGGNGSMDACGKVYKACQKIGADIKVVGIPKTIDNDIAVTDHAPGYGSAARFIAGSTAEARCDVNSLPIHVVVIEAMGRSAGWIAAASAFAQECGIGGPDLIYTPETAFNQDKFLNDTQKIIDKNGCGIIVASEGLHYADGSSIVEPIMKINRATYYGDVSAHLGNLIIKELGYKARSEKPGILGRSSFAWQSETDRNEAVMAGSEAVKAALDGKTGVMVGFERDTSSDKYAVKPILIPIEQVMLTERCMPKEFINAEGNGVTKEFLDWGRPLLGGPLPQFVNFRK